MSGQGSGILTPLSVLCVLACLDPVLSDNCDFQVLDSADFTSIAELQRTLNVSLLQKEKPILLRNALPWWRAEMQKQEYETWFVEHFGDFHLAIGRDLETQSSTGRKAEVLQSILREWVQMWESDTHTTRYTLTWLDESGSNKLNKALLHEYPLPPAMHWTSFKPFFVMGKRSPGIRVHQHEGLTWVALITGTKQWYVLPAHNSAVEPVHGLPAAKTHAEATFRAAGFQHCLQRASEIVLLPSWWWHATFDRDFTFGIGAQNKGSVFVPEVSFAAIVGNTSFFESEEMLHITTRDIVSALHLAAYRGREETIQHLLSKHFLAGSILGTMALDYAAAEGHADEVAVLLEAGARPFLELEEKVQEKHADDDLEFLATQMTPSQLLKLDLAQSIAGVVAFDFAAEKGHVDAVAVLLEAGARPSLEMALKFKHADGSLKASMTQSQFFKLQSWLATTSPYSEDEESGEL